MSAPPPPSFRAALRYWARLGCINFGGPAGQISLLHRDLVERRRWIGEERFLHALNYCMLLPGPEAQQLATYIGWLLHGTRGALAAGLLFVLPSVVVMWTLAAVYVTWGSLPLVAAALAGVQPVVVAIVAEAVVRIGRRAFRHPLHFGFAGAAFVALAAFAVPFPLVVAAAAAAGALLGRSVAGFAPPLASGPAETAAADARPPSGARALRQLAVFAALWLLPLALVAGPLAATLPVGRDLYLFFPRAALVTFGGAYAVLAYVGQVAVESYGWLDAAQMIDGLALAETTPGPLIMVLEFVGFLAGWNRPGALAPLAAATAGALVTVWVTFLPSFAFILAGAPYVEALRGRRGLAAALAGVTAAVVGVILNLAVSFGGAVFAPGGELAARPVVVAALALLLLARFRLAAPWVVLLGALAGVGLALAGS